MSNHISSSLETGLMVDIECRITNGLPNIVIVGFANRSIGEATERLRGAFSSSHLKLPRKRISINLAPGDIPKQGTGFDLAIAMAILDADGQLAEQPMPTDVFIGELGLDGAVRPVRGIIGKLLVARDNGTLKCFVPIGNLAQAQLVPGLTIYPVSRLNELYAHFNQLEALTGLESGRIPPPIITYSEDIQAIVGQSRAKRALEVAAAGGHHVLLNGPPGTGKTMLAQALPSLLPPLNQEEMLEVTHLHSLASLKFDQIVTQRPFRSPHHTITERALFGRTTPGEVGLSQHGVLFLDELPEFRRSSIEALRQPLENTNLIMIAAANPCPCGYYGSTTECNCSPYLVLRYQRKLSGPILDRIDLFAEVEPTIHKQLMLTSSEETSAEVRKRVTRARQIQLARGGVLNSQLDNQAIQQQAQLTKEAQNTLNQAAKRLNISARAYLKLVKIARTIADLEGSKQIQLKHITEALQFRAQQ